MNARPSQNQKAKLKANKRVNKLGASFLTTLPIVEDDMLGRCPVHIDVSRLLRLSRSRVDVYIFSESFASFENLENIRLLMLPTGDLS